ncbi:FAD binding domain-containing protein [Cenococcum geophilum 1.58]|uniref:FAD binding domain-containing protein n=1 Tax=Cenococcum geophilum 1.58 TaxID=794803 RepID=UPI003590291C|nr:FAD binding domain-containing protein [Cenococcum geophilum 1.58]
MSFQISTTPQSSCWPSATEWSTFNNTISGRLVRGVPPASVCYPTEPNYNETDCNYVRSQWFNSTFHADDPISIDYPIWANDSCNPIFPNGTSVTGDPAAGSRGCTIGEYPVYVVNATEADHVSTALKWADQKSVRVVVKNTGHSYPGRSTGYGSLSIWMHNFRGVTFNKKFQSKSCLISGTHMAAIISAGETGFTVLTEMAKHNAVVVVGGNPDVGIMGWFTGGGHGYLSSTYGMGADNLLEATIITPNGDVVTANACSHIELFFAIRGGGGGTYGVVIEAVMRAYPSPKSAIHNLQVGSKNSNISSEYWELMAYIHSELPRLKNGGMQGYYYMVGPPLAPTLSLLWSFYLYDKPNGTAEALFAPIAARLSNASSYFIYKASVDTASNFYDAYLTTASNEPVATGGSAYGSRLLPERALVDMALVAKTFEKIGPSPNILKPSGVFFNTLLLGHLVANSGNRGLDIGMNPAWRDAVVHFVIWERWVDGMPQTLIENVYNDITFNKTYALKQLAPDGGAYFNECDSYEPDWQYSFFGANYPRLRKVKKQYDPNGVLWCRRCVGSEDWIEQSDGSLCHTTWGKKGRK